MLNDVNNNYVNNSYRECIDDCIIMRFAAHFQVDFVKCNIIQYKYMVYSERTMTQDDAYEYLNYKGTAINRAIDIPSNKCVAKGM